MMLVSLEQNGIPEAARDKIAADTLKGVEGINEHKAPLVIVEGGLVTDSVGEVEVIDLDLSDFLTEFDLDEFEYKLEKAKSLNAPSWVVKSIADSIVRIKENIAFSKEATQRP